MHKCAILSAIITCRLLKEATGIFNSEIISTFRVLSFCNMNI